MLPCAGVELFIAKGFRMIWLSSFPIPRWSHNFLITTTSAKLHPKDAHAYKQYIAVRWYYMSFIFRTYELHTSLKTRICCCSEVIVKVVWLHFYGGYALFYLSIMLAESVVVSRLALGKQSCGYAAVRSQDKETSSKIDYT